MPAVSAIDDLKPFFTAQVNAAIARTSLDTPDSLAAYLVGLLEGYVRVPDVPALDAPLASVLAWALEGRPHEQSDRMRCLGDLALFRCGFFPDQLERLGVDEHYAANMGGRAYGAVALGQASGQRMGAELFAALAKRFLDWVRVLGEVREGTLHPSPAQLARLYSRYRISGNPRLAKRLARRGLLVRPHQRGQA